jgi:ParB-like chromosome segregation protein Spo0J
MAAAMDPLKSESVPVTKLLGMGAPYNPRRIDADQLAALRRSLRTFGAVEPVVANRRSGLIVGGHQRVKAAEAEGIETLPVVWVDLDETGERQLNLALNRISGEWDEPALAALLEELGSSAIDLTGFGSDEVDELIARMKRETAASIPTTCRSRRRRPSRSAAICTFSESTDFSTATVRTRLTSHGS